MAKKRIQKIPLNYRLKCPFCGKKMQIPSSKDSSPQFLDCTKCKQRISTPLTKCCVVCAFSNKSCIPSLMMEAKIKNLEIRI